MVTQKDKQTIHSLASQLAEIAALPVQEHKRQMWRKLNRLQPDRPMVMIDQVCWNEMNVDGELTLRCEDQECRQWEQRLRRRLYQWRHFPVDTVIDPFVCVPKAIRGDSFGPDRQEKIAVTDPTNSVVGHAYENLFQVDADLDKIRPPQVRHDAAETARRLEVANELFAGTLEVIEYGDSPYVSVWDPISAWMGVEGALYGLIDRPDFMRELVRRIVAAYMSMLDQMEQQGLLCHQQSLIHCTGAWVDELPAPGFDAKKPRTKDIWMYGLAQMFSTVSPAVFEEFEVEACRPLFERFGLVYYGCCDPLDRKMAQVRKIPNARKVSMSPWVDEELGASQIRGDYVYSRKPNPALLAWPTFSDDAVREHLKTTVGVCARHGCPCELILKDISTVKYEPQRLWRWAEIAMEVVGG